jgi:phosphoglycolate phosphatase
MPRSTGPQVRGVDTVVFDVDGTLLDSAPGILAGFQKALVAGGIVAPDADRLRPYLGPPLREFLITSGVAPDRLDSSAQAYHDFYLAEGLHQARPYPGVEDLLQRLTSAGLRLATATAKRTTTARAIIDAHGLASYFTLVAGTDEARLSKADTLAGVLADLGADPATTIMVGDRRHDVEGAHACRVRAVGAGWGYAVGDELTTAGADWVVDDVQALGQLLGV